MSEKFENSYDDYEKSYEYKEKRPEIIEYSDKELLKLLSSREFADSLTIAGLETKESGYETGFKIHILKTKFFFINDVERGGLSSMSGDTKILKEGINRPLEGDHALMSFHFHPNPNDPLGPSGSDLHLLNDEIENSLIGICSIDKKGDIDVFLVKIRKGFYPDAVEEYEEKFENARYPEN